MTQHKLHKQKRERKKKTFPILNKNQLGRQTFQKLERKSFSAFMIYGDNRQQLSYHKAISSYEGRMGGRNVRTELNW